MGYRLLGLARLWADQNVLQGETMNLYWTEIPYRGVPDTIKILATGES